MWLDKCLVGQMSELENCSLMGQISDLTIDRLENCPVGQILVGQTSVGLLSDGQTSDNPINQGI